MRQLAYLLSWQSFSALEILKEGIEEIHRWSFHCRRNLDGRLIDVVVDLAKKIS